MNDLESRVVHLELLLVYAQVTLVLISCSGVAALWRGVAWVRSRVRASFEAALADIGITRLQLLEAVGRQELATRIRREKKIVVVSPERDRALQLALQREHFRLVLPVAPSDRAEIMAADLVVCDGWDNWAEALLRDTGLDAVVYTGTARVCIPTDLVHRVLPANTHLTLALHAASMLLRNNNS